MLGWAKMILFVSLVRPGKEYQETPQHIAKCRFEELTGRPVLTLHFTQVNPELMSRLPIKAIVLSGSPAPWPELKPKELLGLYDVLRETQIPTLGICAGHQLLGFVFSNDFRKIEALADLHTRPLRPDEPDLATGDEPTGWFLEKGYYHVEMITGDPLFASLNNHFVVRESHMCEVKEVPPGFMHLARTENCEIQAMRHRERLMYGVQFHPEGWTDEYHEGKQILNNFFQLAGLI